MTLNYVAPRCVQARLAIAEASFKLAGSIVTHTSVATDRSRPAFDIKKAQTREIFERFMQFSVFRWRLRISALTC